MKLTTEQGQAAMEEFGFAIVDEDGAFGAPTPGRIADRLHDITTDIEAAVKAGSLEDATAAVAKLRRLRLSLDAWDYAMMLKGDSHA